MDPVPELNPQEISRQNPIWNKWSISITVAVILAGIVGFSYTRIHHISLRPSAIMARLNGTDLYNPSEAFLKEGNPNLNEVALTIDDGPHPLDLPSILKELRIGHIHATFFEVGEMMAKSPELVRLVLADGNEIGNHTMTHPRLTSITPAQVQAQILKCAAEFHSITGDKMDLFRPPGFDEDPAILGEIKALGYITVGWTVGAKDYIKVGDFTPQNPQTIVNDVMNNVKNGSIIILHDAPGTAEAMPALLQNLSARGFKVVMVSQLLAHLPHPVIVQSNAGKLSILDSKNSKALNER